jgi:tRNA(Ile)-lysidine synthase
MPAVREDRTMPAHSADPLDRLAATVGAGADRLGIEADAQLTLAVSGGGDSVALLHGTARLVATGQRAWRLSVAHLDHALRSESAADANFVLAAARSLGLPAEVRRTDVAALARDEGRSVEEAGREARYRFLEEVAPAGGLIATAHTLDDVAETVLINLLRGSGLGGMAGIPARRGRVVRPLLDARGAELRALLDAAGIEYRDDQSNADLAFLRNRVRAEVLPVLESIRPGAAERIGRFSGLAAGDDAVLEELASAELTRRRDETGAIDWRSAPPAAIGRRVLRLAIGDPAPTAERIEALRRAAESDRGGVAIELGAGRSATVRGHRIRIELDGGGIQSASESV